MKWVVLVILIITLLAAYAEQVDIQIYIDNTSPTYDVYEGISLIYDYTEEFFTYAHWVDEYPYKYVLEWNITGYFANDTENYIVDGWSNITKQITPLDEGKSVYYKIYCRDWSRNWGETFYKSFVVASTAPWYSSISQSNDSPVIGDLINITSYWEDNFEVSYAVLQTNETGTWHDNGSPVYINDIGGWANFTIDTTGFNTSPYYWRIRAVDQVNNENITEPMYFTPR